MLSHAYAVLLLGCMQLAGLLPGRDAQECETLYAQYQTFLSLPYSPGLQTAFVAMVKDVYKNKLEEESIKQVRNKQVTQLTGSGYLSIWGASR